MTAFGMISYQQSMDERPSGPVGRAPAVLATRLVPTPEGLAPRRAPGGVFGRIFNRLTAPAPAVTPFKQRVAPVMADGEIIKNRPNWDPKGPLMIQKGTIVPFVNRPAPAVEVLAPVPLATSIQVAAPALKMSAPAPGVPIQTATIQGPGTVSSAPAFEPRPTAQETPATAYQTKAQGFFDQELIPGVKNLYLAAGAGGLLLLLLMMRKGK